MIGSGHCELVTRIEVHSAGGGEGVASAVTLMENGFGGRGVSGAVG